MKADVNRLIELQKLLLSFSQVERMTHRQHLGKFVPENDTEHSYNLAITAWFLLEWFPELDRDRVIRYALAHDLVEVHAGDTYIYGSAEELASKVDRETQALQKLEKDWHDFTDMTETIRAYEAKQDNEARFVYSLDKIMPMMLIYIHEGYTWKKEKVTAEMIHKAKIAKVKLSPEILPYFEQLYQLLLDHPEYIKKS